MSMWGRSANHKPRTTGIVLNIHGWSTINTFVDYTSAEVLTTYTYIYIVMYA